MENLYLNIMRKKIVSQKFYDDLVDYVKYSGDQISSHGDKMLNYHASKFLLQNFNNFYIIMKTIKVPIINNSKNAIPVPATTGAAGMDLRAMIDAPITLKPGKRVLIPTGLHIALPEGYEMQIRPRSGLALKHGISIVNSPGTIDCDYRGDIGIILINLGEEDFVINPGERIAQAVVKEYVHVDWEEVSSLDVTERADKGYNSTGVK